MKARLINMVPNYYNAHFWEITFLKNGEIYEHFLWQNISNRPYDCFARLPHRAGMAGLTCRQAVDSKETTTYMAGKKHITNFLGSWDHMNRVYAVVPMPSEVRLRVEIVIIVKVKNVQ